MSVETSGNAVPEQRPPPPGLLPAFPIRTARLVLRPLGVDDLDALVAYRGREDVCRWIPGDPLTCRDTEIRLAARWSRRGLETAGQAMFVGTELAEQGVIIGDLMLYWASEEHRSGEVGWVFNPEHAGHGYATEAAHAVLHLAFDGLHLHRMTARVDARNGPSARLAERLGMRREAHLVENEWFKGGWSDEIGFALLDREFAALPVVGDCPACGRRETVATGP